MDPWRVQSPAPCPGRSPTDVFPVAARPLSSWP